MTNPNAFFAKRLITWYLTHKRDLPWRNTQDPYKVWLSEIILQQTRVSQGLPYYETFVREFPTVFSLAEAPQQEVLKLWQGLGYYSRARNLHETAKKIAWEYDGVFPNRYEDLLQLKGIGDYTASAIASICFQEPTAVVDGNVYRVLSRIFGISEPINSGKGPKIFKALAQELIDLNEPGTYNQAIMEFGARYCVPAKPDCHSCIFQDRCEAHKTQSVQSLPVKLKKTKIKKHHFNFLVFLSEDRHTMLEQRTQKGIWQQLYQFPLIDTARPLTQKTLVRRPEFQEISKNIVVKEISKYNDDPILHKLSHKDLFTTFWILETGKLPADAIPVQKISSFPVPIILGNFISSFAPFKE